METVIAELSGAESKLKKDRTKMGKTVLFILGVHLIETILSAKYGH